MLLSATSTTVHLNVQLLTLISSVFLPLLVGIVTKEVASSAVKAVVLALLSAITGVVATLIQQGGNFDYVVAINQAIMAFVTATATHFGFWKATGTADAVQGIAPNFGIGGSQQQAGVIDNQMK